jgi:DNA-directed RNA polymerase subunit RPC12/RpoP
VIITIHGQTVEAVQCPECRSKTLIFPASLLERHLENAHGGKIMIVCPRCKEEFAEHPFGGRVHRQCGKCRNRAIVHTRGPSKRGTKLKAGRNQAVRHRQERSTTMKMRKAIQDTNIFLNLRSRGLSKPVRDFEPGPERSPEVRRRLMVQASRPTSETVSLSIGKQTKTMRMLSWPDGTTSLVSLETDACGRGVVSTLQPNTNRSLNDR